MLEADHGADVLAIVRSVADVVLVLTDLRMPVMDGAALFGAMLLDPRLAVIPSAR